jgi:uncharacterized protein (DUF1778 family)
MRRVTKKVETRVEEVAHLLRIRGCVTVRNVMELGLSKTQAEVALRYLTESGRAVRVKLGQQFTLWCYSRRSVVRHLRRLKNVLHSLICDAKMKYVRPGKALELILNDKQARRLFSRYISLKTNSAKTLDAVKSLLELNYGKPITYAGGGPVYFVDCQKSPRPLPSFVYKERKQYTIIRVRVGSELREMVERAAAAEGVSISALVKRAVARLLEGYSQRVEMVLVDFHLPRRLLQTLDEYAQQMGTTRAAVVRTAISQMLEKMKMTQVAVAP